jgi:hypothetical protein
MVVAVNFVRLFVTANHNGTQCGSRGRRKLGTFEASSFTEHALDVVESNIGSLADSHHAARVAGFSS